jgi:hypothetical protein
MAYKITIFYNQYDQGWTETFYTNQTLTPNSFDFPAFVKFLQASINIRGDGVYIYGARWTQLGAARVNYSELFEDTYASGATAGLEEVTAVDYVVKILNVQNQYRHLYLRGLPQVDVVRDEGSGAPKPTAALINGINKYIQAAAQLLLCLQTEQTVTTNPGLLTGGVVSIQANPANAEQSIVTLNQSPTFSGTAPYFVRFNRVPKNDVPGFPRECQALSAVVVSPFSIVIPYRYRAQNTVTYPNNMTFTQQLSNYFQIVSPTTGNPGWSGVNFQERKTGRAFGVPRGRSRVVVSRK